MILLDPFHKPVHGIVEHIRQRLEIDIDKIVDNQPFSRNRADLDRRNALFAEELHKVGLIRRAGNDHPRLTLTKQQAILPNMLHNLPVKVVPLSTPPVPADKTCPGR